MLPLEHTTPELAAAISFDIVEKLPREEQRARLLAIALFLTKSFGGEWVLEYDDQLLKIGREYGQELPIG